MSVDVIQTLRDLVAIPSVNPMGKDVSGPEYLETRVTDYLEKYFDRLGLPWERVTVEPGRDNILARLDGDGDALVVFEAHQDTVPVEGMAIEPFTPNIRDGRIYGRGSCDIKGGMAAMLAAVARLKGDRPRGMPTVVMACSVNEEYGVSGAQSLAETLTRGQSRIIPRRPDGVIVAEPTLLDVVVAHKGIARWKCHTRGRAAHTSQPQLGDNAIYKMTRVIQAFKRYHDEVVPTLREHALCGRPSVCVGTIAGGISVNTVPDRCTIEIDRRVIPGEDPQEAYDRLVAYVTEQADVEGVEQESPYRQVGGLSDETNGALAEQLAAAARHVRGACAKIGVPFGTDACVLAPTGVPTVVFGPGSIDQAHTKDEWLDLSQLQLAVEILVQFCKVG